MPGSSDPHEDGLAGLGQAFTMIIVSEIGDKTFLIAAILAMRHDRLTVFAGAFGSLLVMSVLSAGMGRVLPTLLPKMYTQLAAAVLFFAFGIKMFREAREMSDDNEKLQEEMREAEEEIDIDEDDIATDPNASYGTSVPLRHIEEGGTFSPTQHTRRFSSEAQNGTTRTPSPKSRSRTTRSLTSTFKYTKANLKRTFRHIFGPVLAQSFILTFLGEWGDRSQIATIALAAAHSMTLVALGTVLGHACCTAVAVMGGRWVSTKISIKRVTLFGSVLFIVFGVIYLFEALYSSSSNKPIALNM